MDGGEVGDAGPLTTEHPMIRIVLPARVGLMHCTSQEPGPKTLAERTSLTLRVTGCVKSYLLRKVVEHLVCRPLNRFHSLIQWELGGLDAALPGSPTGTIGSSLMTIVPVDPHL